MTKAHLAEICELCPTTIREYCNVRYLSELQKLGYRPTQKKFTPKQWAFLMQKLVVV